jgi:hypothetical protein
MKLSKEDQKDIIKFVSDTITNPFGFAEYLDQNYQLETGWWVHLEVTKEVPSE